MDGIAAKIKTPKRGKSGNRVKTHHLYYVLVTIAYVLSRAINVLTWMRSLTLFLPQRIHCAAARRRDPVWHWT